MAKRAFHGRTFKGRVFKGRVSSKCGVKPYKVSHHKAKPTIKLAMPRQVSLKERFPFAFLNPTSPAKAKAKEKAKAKAKSRNAKNGLSVSQLNEDKVNKGKVNDKTMNKGKVKKGKGKTRKTKKGNVGYPVSGIGVGMPLVGIAAVSTSSSSSSSAWDADIPDLRTLAIPRATRKEAPDVD